MPNVINLPTSTVGLMKESVYDPDQTGKVLSAVNADKVNGHTVNIDVPANAKFTDTVYTPPEYWPMSMVMGLTENLDAKTERIQKNNILVTPLEFYTDPDLTYEAYPFCVDIPIEGVTQDMVPQVVFNVLEASSGLFAPVAETLEGIVRIYAAKIYETDFQIPTVLAWKHFKPLSVVYYVYSDKDEVPGTDYGVWAKLDSSISPVERFYVSDILTDQVYPDDLFTIKQEMNTAYNGMVAHRVNNTFYVFGGRTIDDSDLASNGRVRTYDSKTGSLITLPGVQSSAYTSFAASVVINNKIYFFGGLSSSAPHDIVQIYDTETNDFTVSTVHIPNGGLWNACAVALPDNRIMLIGGRQTRTETVALDNVYIYDPSTETFDQACEQLAEPIYGAAACLVEDKVYVFGGYPTGNGTPAYKSVQVIDITQTSGTATVIEDVLPDNFRPCSSSAIYAYTNTYVYIFNCKPDNTGIINTVYGIQDNSIVNIEIPNSQIMGRLTAGYDLPITDSGIAVDPERGEVYIFGGNNSTDILHQYSKDIICYQAAKWRFQPNSLVININSSQGMTNALLKKDAGYPIRTYIHTVLYQDADKLRYLMPEEIDVNNGDNTGWIPLYST